MTIWLSGTFGAGKTATARALAATMPDARLFDHERPGFPLRPNDMDAAFMLLRHGCGIHTKRTGSGGAEVTGEVFLGASER